MSVRIVFYLAQIEGELPISGVNLILAFCSTMLCCKLYFLQQQLTEPHDWIDARIRVSTMKLSIVAGSTVGSECVSS